MALWGCLVVALGTGVAACGGDSGSSSSGGGSTGSKDLTIYSSLPLQGASRVNSEAVNNGAKMALKTVNNKVGSFKITYKQLDDSTASAGKWDQGQTSSNARKAVQDKSTIAYLGEFNSGATAISLPILNQAGIPQVSPSNTAVGLTSDEPGADVGEPQKYYPAGTHTYARVVPRDTVQGAAVTEAMKEDGCKSVFIVNDKEVYGQGLSKVVEGNAPRPGSRSPATTATTRRRPTTARWPRRSRARARTASSARSSSTTTASSCTRTSTPACRA